MSGLLRIIGFGLILSLATPAESQKLYRWVDADGKVHYSDSLPAEAVDRARRELNKNSGGTLTRVDRALTEAERAAQQAEADRAAAEAAEQDSRRKRDQVLLQSYLSEADLTRAYQDRLAMLDESIQSAQIGIESQRQLLSSLLNDAADRELAGERVTSSVLEAAREAYRQEQLLHELQMRREAERVATDQEYQAALSHYRELTAAEP